MLIDLSHNDDFTTMSSKANTNFKRMSYDFTQNINTSEQRVTRKLKDEVDRIDGEIATINEQLTQIGEQITTIQNDITTIQGDITSLQEDLATLNNNLVQAVNTINSAIDEINRNIGNLAGNINDLWRNQGNVPVGGFVGYEQGYDPGLIFPGTTWYACGTITSATGDVIYLFRRLS